MITVVSSLSSNFKFVNTDCVCADSRCVLVRVNSMALFSSLRLDNVEFISSEINFSICPAPVQAVCYAGDRCAIIESVQRALAATEVAQEQQQQQQQQ